MGQLTCDGPVAPLGAAENPASIAGSAQAPTLEQSVNNFVMFEAAIYAFLPLGGWAIGRRDEHYAVVAHQVGGRTKAAALFSDGNDPGPAGPWRLWTVAACDASEFSPQFEISYGLKVWSTEAGRARTSTVLDMIPACDASEVLSVDGKVFLRSPTDRSGIDRTVYQVGVSLPSDAIEAPYSDGDRRVWLRPDDLAAFVGSVGDLEQWPRLEGDDFSLIDCN